MSDRQPRPSVVMGYVLHPQTHPVLHRWSIRASDSLVYQIRRIMRLNGIDDPAAAMALLESHFAAHPGDDPETYY